MTQSLSIPKNQKNMIIYMHPHVRADSWYTYVHIYTYIQHIYELNTGQERVLWWGHFLFNIIRKSFMMSSFIFNITNKSSNNRVISSIQFCKVLQCMLYFYLP